MAGGRSHRRSRIGSGLDGIIETIARTGGTVEVDEDFYRTFLEMDEGRAESLVRAFLEDALRAGRRSAVANSDSIEGLVRHVMTLADLFAGGWCFVDPRTHRILMRRPVGPKPAPETAELIRARVRALGDYARRMLTVISTRN